MKELPPFQSELYLAEFELTAPHQLSCSDYETPPVALPRRYGLVLLPSGFPGQSDWQARLGLGCRCQSLQAFEAWLAC